MGGNEFGGDYKYQPEGIKLYNKCAIEVAKTGVEKGPVSDIHIPILAYMSGIDDFKLKVGLGGLFRRSPYLNSQHNLTECANTPIIDTDDIMDQMTHKIGLDNDSGFRTLFKKVGKTSSVLYRNHQIA